MVQVRVLHFLEKKAEFHEHQDDGLEDVRDLLFHLARDLAHGREIYEHAVAALFDRKREILYASEFAEHELYLFPVRLVNADDIGPHTHLGYILCIRRRII